MAVRIDIRPRLTLRDEPPARSRRGFRLPPLTLPSVAYWLAMGALTYFFAHPENPLESAAAAEPAATVEPAPSPTPVEPPQEPVALPEPGAPVVAQAEPPADTEASPRSEPERRELPQPEDARAETRPEPRRDAEPAHEAPIAAAEPPTRRLEFPEFTDSSPARRAERAADGPRIDGLFERREERERPSEPTAPVAPPETDRDAPTVVTSCEQAIARNSEQLELGAPRGPVDITRDQYAAILQNGRYLAGCSIPDRTVFEICAAVKNGRAVGITVTSSPASPALSQCVRRAVARLKFPSHPKLDVTHTRFDAQGR